MAFYIRKSVGTGTIRFNVGERRTDEAIGDDGVLFSTGPAGEYRSVGGGGLYFHEETGPGVSAGRKAKQEREPLTPREIGERVIMGLGALLILIGILVLARTPADESKAGGYIEIILGLAMVVTPPVLNAKKRREKREAEERARLEREALEKKHRELAATFASKAQLLRNNRDAASLAAVRAEREAAEVPYAAIRNVARDTAIAVAFDAVARFDSLGAEGVAREILETIDAVGLEASDALVIRKSVYDKLLWHILADDRLTEKREKDLEAVRKALRLSDEDVPEDRTAIEEFRRLKGVTKERLLVKNPPIQLAFQEKCHHVSSGSLMKSKREKKKLPDGTRTTEEIWTPSAECKVFVTSRRVIVEGKGGHEISFAELDDVELDADRNLLSLTSEGVKTPLHLRLTDAIFTGSAIGIVSSTGEKRPGFFNN